jgi:hypothetical protein
MKKRIIALVALLVLLVSICATSFAKTTYPYAKLYGYSKSVTVGNQAYFKFKLKSGSAYKKLDGAFRAKLNILIKYDGKTLGAANWLWTGNQTYKCNALIKDGMEEGTYTMTYKTYKRKSASAKWTVGQKAKSVKFNVHE